MAAIDALLIRKRANIEQALAALNIAFDHPVKRSAFKQFINTFGNHACRVKLFRDKPGSALLRKPEIDPGCEIFDAIAADAKFDEIKCHEADLAKLNAGFK
jgi:hypothetical protein